MCPADSRAGRLPVMSSLRRWVPPTRRVSQVPRSIFRHAPSPTTPDGPRGCSCSLLRAGDRLRDLWNPWPTITWRNEVESGSLALRLASSPREASKHGLLRTPLSQLHVVRAIHMASSFLLARLTRLNLALQRRQGAKAQTLGDSFSSVMATHDARFRDLSDYSSLGSFDRNYDDERDRRGTI